MTGLQLYLIVPLAPLAGAPDSPPGVLLPPPKARAGEMLAQHRAKTLGIPVIQIHRAVLSVQQDANTLPAKLHPNNPKAQRVLAEAHDDDARTPRTLRTSFGTACETRSVPELPPSAGV